MFAGKKNLEYFSEITYIYMYLHIIKNYLMILFFQGSFPKSGFSFKVYMPATKQVEDSQIPND